MVRHKDVKVRMALSRKFPDRVLSNWHGTRDEAFEHLRRKCISMKRDEPAISHTHNVEEEVAGIEPIYGLYRDGKEMSERFQPTYMSPLEGGMLFAGKVYLQLSLLATDDNNAALPKRVRA